MNNGRESDRNYVETGSVGPSGPTQRTRHWAASATPGDSRHFSCASSLPSAAIDGPWPASTDIAPRAVPSSGPD